MSEGKKRFVPVGKLFRVIGKLALHLGLHFCYFGGAAEYTNGNVRAIVRLQILIHTSLYERSHLVCGQPAGTVLLLPSQRKICSHTFCGGSDGRVRGGRGDTSAASKGAIHCRQIHGTNAVPLATTVYTRYQLLTLDAVVRHSLESVFGNIQNLGTGYSGLVAHRELVLFGPRTSLIETLGTVYVLLADYSRIGG